MGFFALEWGVRREGFFLLWCLERSVLLKEVVFEGSSVGL